MNVNFISRNFFLNLIIIPLAKTIGYSAVIFLTIILIRFYTSPSTIVEIFLGMISVNLKFFIGFAVVNFALIGIFFYFESSFEKMDILFLSDISEPLCHFVFDYLLFVIYTAIGCLFYVLIFEEESFILFKQLAINFLVSLMLNCLQQKLKLSNSYRKDKTAKEFNSNS